MVAVENSALGRRARNRAATVDEIKAVARAQLARDGSASINLRAIARVMGVTPSALYRYFASRDDILTALIADAYNDLGAVVEASVAGLSPTDAASQFLTAAGAFRSWAKSTPSQFALLYGSPVPGFQPSPELTKPPAMRTGNVLMASLQAGLQSGEVQIPYSAQDIPLPLRSVLSGVALGERPDLPAPAAIAVAMMAWMSLLGFLTCELFSHWPPELAPASDQFFDFQMRQVLIAIGTEPRVAAEARLVPAVRP